MTRIKFLALLIAPNTGNSYRTYYRQPAVGEITVYSSNLVRSRQQVMWCYIPPRLFQRLWMLITATTCGWRRQAAYEQWWLHESKRLYRAHQNRP